MYEVINHKYNILNSLRPDYIYWTQNMNAQFIRMYSIEDNTLNANTIFKIVSGNMTCYICICVLAEIDNNNICTNKTLSRNVAIIRVQLLCL